MRITKITGNYYNRFNNQHTQPKVNKNQSIPNFKGAMNPQQVKKFVNILKPLNIDCVIGNLEAIEGIGAKLIKRHQDLGLNTIGVFLIPDNELAWFTIPIEARHTITENTVSPASQYKGICIAIGENDKPIEEWDKVIDAEILLVKKASFKI